MRKRTLKRWHFLVWEQCKRIIRSWYVNNDGSWTCYTCGKILREKKDVQTGHGKAKSLLKIRYKYDLRNLKIQCYNCNINLGGLSDIFIAKLEREPKGLEFLKETCVKFEGRWVISHTDDFSKAIDYLPGLLDNLTQIV